MWERSRRTGRTAANRRPPAPNALGAWYHASMQAPLTREEVEHPGFGLRFILEGVDEATGARANESLIDLLLELAGPEEKPGLNFGHLRLIHFVHDLPAEVRRWQRQLGRPEIVSDADGASIGGKALVWGDGRTGTTHGVVLLAAYMVEGVAERRGTNLALVAHELAHADLDWQLIVSIGPVLDDHNHAGDWEIVGLQLAVNAIAEAYAESVAGRYTEEVLVIEAEHLLVTMAEGVLRRMRGAIAEYRRHANAGKLWGVTIFEVSAYLNQLGRVTGFSIRDGDTRGVGGRLAMVHQAFSAHPGLFRQAFLDVASAGNVERAAFAPASRAVAEVLGHFGVEPVWEGGRLRLEVPLWPGDTSR